MRSLFRASTALVILALVASTARAITYGQPDGDRHPNVGALVGTFDGQTLPYCSGTLISPTVFMTAAHCAIETHRVSVTFDSVVTPQATLYAGTFYGDPDYSHRQNDPHDIAVVVLDQPIFGIVPAQLPAPGQLEKVGKDQQFTAVGYGGQEPVNQPGGIVIRYLDTREYAVSAFNALNKAYLRLSQNPATGDGGTCYGDSGGPNVLGAGDSETSIVAAISIKGDTYCHATNVAYRLDTESARGFLARFVVMP